MKEPNGPNDLRAIAHEAMTDRGREPDSTRGEKQRHVETAVNDAAC